MEQVLVRDIMSGPTQIHWSVSVTPDTTLAEATRLMHKHKIHQVPVVSADGQIIGTVCESDIARAMIEMAPQTEQREFTLAQLPQGMSVK
jgi:predicted transcriptional regulator